MKAGNAKWRCAIVVLLTILITALACTYFFTRFRLEKRYEAPNPLDLALYYGSPPERFDQLLVKHAHWINYKGWDGRLHPPVLATYAKARLTNHVSLLIKHGADVRYAVSWLERHKDENSISLIEKLCERNAKGHGSTSDN